MAIFKRLSRFFQRIKEPGKKKHEVDLAYSRPRSRSWRRFWIRGGTSAESTGGTANNASTSLTRLFSRLLKRRNSKPRRNDAESDGSAAADMKESDIVSSSPSTRILDDSGPSCAVDITADVVDQRNGDIVVASVDTEDGLKAGGELSQTVDERDNNIVWCIDCSPFGSDDTITTFDITELSGPCCDIEPQSKPATSSLTTVTELSGYPWSQQEISDISSELSDISTEVSVDEVIVSEEETQSSRINDLLIVLLPILVTIGVTFLVLLLNTFTASS